MAAPGSGRGTPHPNMDSKVAETAEFIRRKRDHQLSDETVQVLCEIARSPATKAGIIEITGIGFHTVRRITDTLQRSGHIISKADVNDRRVAVFHLTDHGRRLIHALLGKK